MEDCRSIKTWIISENLLREFIEATADEGECPHRGIKRTLETLLEYGYSWRDNIQVILTNDIKEVSSEFDEDYQSYLDSKACHEEAEWIADDNDTSEEEE